MRSCLKNQFVLEFRSGLGSWLVVIEHARDWMGVEIGFGVLIVVFRLYALEEQFRLQATSFWRMRARASHA